MLGPQQRDLDPFVRPRNPAEGEIAGPIHRERRGTDLRIELACGLISVEDHALGWVAIAANGARLRLSQGVRELLPQHRGRGRPPGLGNTAAENERTPRHGHAGRWRPALGHLSRELVAHAYLAAQPRQPDADVSDGGLEQGLAVPIIRRFLGKHRGDTVERDVPQADIATTAGTAVAERVFAVVATAAGKQVAQVRRHTGDAEVSVAAFLE